MLLFQPDFQESEYAATINNTVISADTTGTMFFFHIYSLTMPQEQSPILTPSITFEVNPSGASSIFSGLIYCLRRSSFIISLVIHDI